MTENAATSQLTLSTEQIGDTAIVHCSGRLIAGVSDRLDQEARPLIPVSKRIVLDFANLSHMDSTGIAVVVRLHVSAKSSGCTLQLMNVGKPIMHLLGVTHLISVFQIIGENNIRMGP